MAFKAMLRPVHDFWGWLMLDDYETAKNEAAIDVIKRYARGNVAFQNGYVLDDEALATLSRDGDNATARLAKKANIS